MTQNENFKKVLDSIKGFTPSKTIAENECEGLYFGYFAPAKTDVQVEVIVISNVPNVEKVYSFKNRIERLKKVSHPYIVKMIHSKMTKEYGLILLDSSESDRLRDVIDNVGATSPHQALSITRDIALALEACHANNLLHGEIRPSNILIDEEGKIKVRNFFTFEKSKEYVLGMLGRRPEYVSPEIISLDKISFKTDIYSIGVMLFEMLTGKPPFIDDDLENIWKMHLSSDVPSLADKFSEIPQIDKIITKCLAKSPDARYSSISELLQEINQTLLIIPESLSFKRYAGKVNKPSGIRVKKASEKSKSNNTESKGVPEVSKKKKKLPTATLVTLGCFLLSGLVIYLQISGEQQAIDEEAKLAKKAKEDEKYVEHNRWNKSNPRKNTPVKKKKTKEKKSNKKGSTAVNTAEPNDEETENAISEFEVIQHELTEIKESVKKPKAEAIAFLEEKLESPTPMIRLLAIQILRDIRSDNIVHSGDEYEEKMELATKIFKNIHHEDPKERLKVIAELENNKGVEKNEYLLLLARDPVYEVQIKALRELSASKYEEALPILSKMLVDSPNDVLVFNMITKYDKLSEEHLMTHLKSEDLELKKKIVQLAKFYNTEESLNSLSKMISNNDSLAFHASMSLSAGGENHYQHLEKLILGSHSESVKKVAFEGVLQIKEPYKKMVLGRIAENATGNIQELGSMYTLCYSDKIDNVQLTRKKLEFLLNTNIEVDQNKLAKALVSQLSLYDESVDKRIVSSLIKMQDGSLPALKVLFLEAENKNKNKKRFILSIINQIRSAFSAKIFTELYGDREYNKMILNSLVELDPLSIEPLLLSSMPKELVIDTLADMPSRFARKAYVQSLETYEGNLKPILTPIFKKGSDTTGIVKAILLHSKNENLLKAVVGRLNEDIVPSVFLELKKLLESESDSIRQLAFYKLENAPGQLQKHLLEIISDTRYQDVIEMGVKSVKAGNPDASSILKKGFQSDNENVRFSALENFFDNKLTNTDVLLELYAREKDKKILKSIIKYFSKAPHNKNVQFHLLSCGSKNSSLRKSSQKFLNTISTNDKKVLSDLCNALSKNYNVEVKKSVISILYSKHDQELLESLSVSLPSKNKEDGDLFRKTFKRYGKNAGATLIKRMNASPESVNEIKSILKELKLPFAYDIKSKRFALE